MPQKYRVKLSDGRSFDVETEGGPPSEADVMSMLEKGSAPTAEKKQTPEQQRRQDVRTAAKQSWEQVAEVGRGAVKGLANTAITAGKIMYQTAPPVRGLADSVTNLVGAVTDPVRMRQTGQRQPTPPVKPAALMGEAQKATEAQTPLERVGKTAEQVAEFFVLPSGKAVEAKTIGQWVIKNTPQLAKQAVEAMGLTALQGGTPEQVGATGAVTAAIPVAGKPVEAAVQAVAKPATKLVQKALGAGKERFKAMAEKVAPELLRRNVGGATGIGREALLAKATTEAKKASGAIDAALQQSGGQAVKTAPLVSALEDAKSAFKIEHPVTAAQLAADPKLAKTAREVAPGQFVTDVVLDERTIRHLSRLQKTLNDLGPDATVAEVVAVRRAWDAVVDQAGGFTQRAKGAIGVPLKDSSEAWAKREATTAIRKVLSEEVPDLAKVNKEYSFWANVRDVLRQTEKRTAPQEGSLGRNIVTAGGMVAGASSGDGMVDRAEKAILAGALARRIDLVVRSPRWRMASAQLRYNLAEAIAEGNVSKITFMANRIMGGAAAQVASPSR